MDKPNNENELFNILNPIVEDWFRSKFDSFCIPQKYGVLPIHSRENILISAPTGSGKCITPNSTLLINVDGEAKLLTGNQLMQLSEKGKLMANVDKSGKLFSVPNLKSYSLSDNQIKKNKSLIYYEDYQGKIYSIKTEYGREIKLSPDHPLLVEKDGKEEWIPAKDISLGDKIGVPIKIDLPEKNINLDYQKAIKNLRKSAEIVITYEDYMRLKKKTDNFDNFDKLDSRELYNIKTLLRTSFKEISNELNLGLTTIFRLFNKDTEYKREDLICLLKKKCKKIIFEKNRIIFKNGGNQTFSFRYPTMINIRLVRWVAFVLAEGLIGDYEKGTHLLISQKNRTSLLREFFRNSKYIFDIQFKQRTYKDYAIYSTLFCYFLTDLLDMKRGRGRYVPLSNWLLNAKKDIKSNFLNVFFSLESTIVHGREIRISQSNQNKIEVINYLLLSFGIFSSISKRIGYATNTKNKTKRTYYYLTIRKIKNIKLFLDNIDIDHQHKCLLEKQILKKTTGEYVLKHRFDYKKISALSKFYKTYKDFLEDFKNIQEVIRKTGYATESALSKLRQKIQRFRNDFAVKKLINEINILLSRNVCWLNVNKIEALDYSGKLVDLTVPDVHNFIGGYGGIYLHNTLTAFLSILNELVDSSTKGILEDRVYAVYVSPLKALSSDIHVNLVEPLEQIEKIAGKELGIRVGVRTGDTSTKDRAAMLKKPPHILISTPESLSIMLASPKFRDNLKNVDWFILDEVHALAENKRGVHLSLSVEMLQRLSPGMTRVGLSATVAPLEKIAEYLVGYEGGKCRKCKIVDVQFIKQMDLKVLSPVPDLIDVEHGTMHQKMYELMDKLIQDHKTTLIFTNTRAATERVVHHLKEKFPKNYAEEIKDEEGSTFEDKIGAHHGSLSKEHRLKIETDLRDGKLKCVVCLEGDTKILDAKGNWIKIKDIEKTYVQSVNPNLKINNNKIKNIFKTKNNKKLLRLETKFGKEIKCTKNHKFLTINKEGEILWKEAEHLDLDDFIATIREYNYKILSDSDINLFLFRNYPDNYYVFLDKKFLASIKSKITKRFGNCKIFWDKNLSRELSYSSFTHILLGVYGLRIGILRKLIGFLDMSELETFDKIKKVSSDKYKMPKPMINKDMVRLIGFMLAEGYLSDRDLFVSNKNKKVLSYYSRIIKRLSGKDPFFKIGSTGTPILVWSSKFLCALLKNLKFKIGRKARIVNIPKFIFRLDSKLVFTFLSAYMDGDGYLEVKDGKRVYAAGFSTTSKEMAEDISRLLLGEGILSSIRSRYCDSVQKLKNGREIIKKGWFYDVVILGGENLRKFAKNIDPVRNNLKRLKEVLLFGGYTNCDVIPNLGSRLKELRKKAGVSTYKLQKLGLNPMKYELGTRSIIRNQLKRLLRLYDLPEKLLEDLSNSDLFWEKIKSKEEIGVPEFVYNLEVEEDHNYIANGFLTKNCSTSLELGIDIGYIDLVIMLSSPKSVARALQRVGRSGHQLHSVTKGRIIVMDRDDLVECAVLLKSAVEKKIDKIHIPENCLDVLSQQIDGIAIQEKIHINDLKKMIKQSYCYRNLSDKDFMDVIDYLSGKFIDLEDRHVYAKVWYDEDTGMIGRRGKMGRVIYMTNIGTIPESHQVIVKVGTQTVGRIEEAFLEKLKPGDIFILGGSVYQFKFARGTVAQVRGSVSRPPTVPRWFSEMLPLSFDLANDIGKFRKLLCQKFCYNKPKKEIIKFINDYLYIDKNGAESIYKYFWEQFHYSKVPSNTLVLVENYFDGQRYYVVFHTLFGRRVNDCLSRAMAFAIARSQHKSVDIGISDNGFYIASEKKILALKAFKLIKSKDLRKIMDQAIDKTEVLNRRFRHCANRSLMILRNYMGRTKRVGRQQVKSMILMSAVRRISEDFPILKEARREVLEDLMDIDNAKLVLEGIEKKKIKVEEVVNNMPSPFALNLITQGHTDVMKIEDKQEFLRRMHKNLIVKLSMKKDIKKEEIEEFNYHKEWEKTEKKIEEEKDSAKEELKTMAWNLKRVPMFIKEEVVEMIDGKKEASSKFVDAVHKYKKEIEKTWPKKLRDFVLEKVK